MITAVEKDRRLHVTIGDDEGSLTFVVPPVSADDGLVLLRALLGITALEGERSLALIALGAEVHEKAQVLRGPEFAGLVRAASYWNAFGNRGLDTHLAETPEEKPGRLKSGRSAAEATIEDLAEFGVGDPDPVTGRYPRYVYPAWFRKEIQQHGASRESESKGVSTRDLWVHVLDTWDTDTLCDLREVFHVDLFDLHHRPWWWLRGLIDGLLTSPRPTRLSSWATAKKPD